MVPSTRVDGPRFRKGQYVVAKYEGRGNGDLIVGRIEGIRSSGHVLVANCLSGQISTKKYSVLSRRNAPVPKAVAMRVVDKFKLTGSRAAAKTEAVSLAHGYVKRRPRTKGVDPKVAALVKDVRALSEVQFDAFARQIWGEVLKHFGVQ